MIKFIKVNTTSKQEMYLNVAFIESVVTATAVNGPTRLRFNGLNIDVSEAVSDIFKQMETANVKLVGAPWYKKVFKKKLS